ncbi:Rpn family recombination-promoting nuclease/putative transposase [Nocardia aurantia]|uniref:Recombination-promoting nuclease RpnD n=1 Tax=Nocardia aurantia TaxID=2585199 RepID=A0A7K0DW66_9NOCA|nr:Rpn family recombination-promoting nuclease/putative transposase [Nocardia aurantia]MQY29074.1 Recombination-promoting nuclease RpnD [Nocardia aurantia]
MGEKPSNPHDAYFRAELSDPEVAAGQVRAVLSAEMLEQLDLTVLDRQSVSFVPAELRSRYSDILFRTRFAARDAFVYLLIEHQSSQDPLMAFRITEYLVAIWNRYLEDHKKDRPPVTRLPLVIPMVVHVSADGARWTEPVDLGDVLDIDPDVRDLLGDHLPRMRFLLDDVNALDVQQLLQRKPAALSMVLVMLRNAPRHTHLDQVLSLLEELLRDLTSDQLSRLLAYIFTVGRTDADTLQPVFERIGPSAKEAMMTIADDLRAEGGANLLIDQLSVKFGPLSERVLRRVRGADAATLRDLSRRFIFATSIDDVVAE